MSHILHVWHICKAPIMLLDAQHYTAQNFMECTFKYRSAFFIIKKTKRKLKMYIIAQVFCLKQATAKS